MFRNWEDNRIIEIFIYIYMPAGMDKHWGKLREALKQREIKGDFWVLGLDR